MTTQLHTLLVRGDLQTPREEALFARLGFRLAAQPVRNVPGAIVPRVVSEGLRQSSELIELAAVSRSQGWTVLSLSSEGLLADPAALLELSASLGTRVVSARCDEFGAELGVFDNGVTRRFAAWEEGEELMEIGEPLGAEEDFAGEVPDAHELVALLDELGFDLVRANTHALYSVFALQACPEGEVPVQDAPVAMPNNLVSLFSETCANGLGQLRRAR